MSRPEAGSLACPLLPPLPLLLSKACQGFRGGHPASLRLAPLVLRGSALNCVSVSLLAYAVRRYWPREDRVELQGVARRAWKGILREQEQQWLLRASASSDVFRTCFTAGLLSGRERAGVGISNALLPPAFLATRTR